MKNIILIFLVIFLSSCESDESRIKKIIDDSYYGLHRITKMGEIEKLKEDIFSLPVFGKYLETYIPEPNLEHDYEIVRYIYKTYDGANRMYFLIDMTERKVLEKSSDVESFFKPLYIKILGDTGNYDIEGDNIMSIYRY